MSSGDLGFVPRTRSAMEAVDLGLSLLQRHWRPVAAVWTLQVLLVLGLCLPFLYRSPLWILTVLWWVKPWLDRGVLFVLSRAVFGQSATVWEFLQAWRPVHRTGLLAGLTWRRLSARRSYVLPVFQLEGLRGAAYRARVRVLARQGGGTAFLLTGAGWAFTLLTGAGCLAFLQAMVPPGSRAQVWSGFQGLSAGYQGFLVAVGLLALCLSEPLFVAAGFGLYLNRRTHLEGWDLEHAFRRLAARLALGLLLLACAWPLRAQAPEPVPAPPAQAASAPGPGRPALPDKGPLRPGEEPRQRARRVRDSDPAFRHTKEVRTLKYAPTGREPRWLRALLDALFAESAPAKPSEPWNADLMKRLWEAIALVGKVVLVGALLAFVLWLAFRFRHRLGLPDVAGTEWEAPEAIAGHDIRPETLPPDVPAAARRLFERGEVRAAVALLYRGALADLVHRRGLEIPASATEGDCLRSAQAELEPVAAGAFRFLTTTWQRLAYNEEPPGPEAFDALCGAWAATFGGRP